MRKVNNKKVIRRLSHRSFQAAKTRNLIAILAIMLTTIMFTTLFTLGLGTMENVQRETMRQSGGDSHGVFKNLTREQYEKLSKDPSIVESADCMMVADTVENEEFLKRHLEAWYYPEHHYPHCFVEILDGKAPKKADEILIDETSMELLGLKPQPGQKVTLQLKVKDSHKEVTERTFTVSGVIKADPALNVGFALVSPAYLKAHADELTYTYQEDYSNTGAIRMDVNFKNSMNIQKNLDQVITNAGYSTEQNDPDYIASNANWAYISDGAESDPMTIGAMTGGLFLIILTGYLIIYNIFQISVIRDIRYYGLLKTIGTTGKQIKKIIRRQAMLLGMLGIPFGLVFGFLMGKGIMPKMMDISAYGSENVVVSLNPWIFIGAAVFTLLTIWISTGKPVRIAAKVSPVEAVRYADGTVGRKKEKSSINGGKIHKMALANLGRNKKRTVLVIFSLSLAVVLLNSVYTLTHSFDMDKYLKKFVSSDFLIANAVYFNSEYYGLAENMDMERLSEEYVDYCKSLDGYQKGGRLYMTGNIGLRKDSWTAPSYIPQNKEGVPGEYWNGEFVPYNEYDEKNWDTRVYGVEDYFYRKFDVWKGEKDPDVIREKLKSGNYLLCVAQTDDNDFVVEETVVHQPGDKIKLTCPDGTVREFTILSLVKENYYGLSNRMGATFAYYTDAKVFKEMDTEKHLMSFSFDAQDDKEKEIVEKLEQYTTMEEPLMHYESKFFWLEQFSQLTGIITLVGGVLTIIVTVVGLLNFINSILTGIVTRQGEFAMLQAIGMTRKQLKKMLVLEGIYYGLGTMLCSLVLGILFSVTALKALTGGLWFMQYHFTMLPMIPVFPILLVLGILIPALSFRFYGKESVVERIRKFN